MSNRLTFSLASLILIFALVAMPAMAGQFSANWSSGQWSVTVTFPAEPAPTAPTATTLTTLDITALTTDIAEQNIAEKTTGVPAGKKQWTFDIAAANGVTVLVQLSGYQRVIFPEAAPGGTLPETTLVHLAKLKSVPTPLWVKANVSKDIVFIFEAANAATKIGAPQDLHISDVVEAGGSPGSFVYEVSGSDTVMVTYRNSSPTDGENATYTLSNRIVTASTPVSTLSYDSVAPAYPASPPSGDGETTIPVNRRKPAAPNQWGAVAFDYIFTIIEEHSGIQSVMLEDNQNLLSFANVAPTGEDSGAADRIIYGATVSTQNKNITAGTQVTIFATVTDKAGNEAELNIGSVTLAEKVKTVTPTTPAAFSSADPASGEVGQGQDITLTFDKAPSNLQAVSVPTGSSTITGSGKTRTLEISPTQIVGALKITLSWGTSSTQVLNYTVTQATPVQEVTVPPNSYVIVTRGTQATNPGLKSIEFPSNVSGVAGSANPSVTTWADMPNLDDMFRYGGGTIAITIKSAAADALFDHDADTTTDARQYKLYDLIITEVMAAVNEAKLGTAGQDDHQWIEIYNPNKTSITARLRSEPGVGGLNMPSDEVLLDRLSNVIGARWQFDIGANGSDDLNPETADTKKPFVSFYRKHDKYGADGATKGHWVTSTDTYTANYKGSPGAKERAALTAIGTDTVPRSPIIFNEISNNTNSDHEWIELRNVSDDKVNLKDYEVTILTSKGADQDSHNDVDLIDFTDADRNVPAGGILLVVKKDPTGDSNHPLAAGWNFGARNTWTVATSEQAHYVPGVNENSPRYIVAKSFGNLPDEGNFVLVLRNRQDRNGSTADANIRDIAGYVPDDGLKVDNTKAFTHLWPLSNFAAPSWSNNNLKSGTVQRRQHASKDGTGTTDKNQDDKTAFRDDDNGWTGIGYKRNATPNAQNGGTPGYAHGVLRSNDTDANDAVIISEIMPTKGNGNLPEWIELRNLSSTIGVNVDNWRLTITNHNSDGAGVDYPGDLTHTITLSGRIPPLQTYLVVARTSRDRTDLPAERIKKVGRTRAQHLLNPYGFEIKLESKKDNDYLEVDTVGNLGAPEGRRSKSFSEIMWALPASMSDGDRVSIVRVFMNDNPLEGTTKGAWASFEGTEQAQMIERETYYGHESDFSSPGHHAGGVLPVSLSKFRPERLESGEIVIRWITQSELNNAGFNILRGEKRDGEFKQINTKLIAGQGTTSEKTTYEWKDTSAKPTVVYYYQIQDVSLDGQVQTLRVSRLKGHISPAGKATTTWGELKALQ